MPKANLTQSVEAIADRVAKRNLKNCRAIIQLGTWLKTLEDENRELKQRIEGLEIRVQKLNNYGATLLSQKEATAEKAASSKPGPPITAGQLKRFRMSRQLSQAAMAALLGVSDIKYVRWEGGKSKMLPAVEEKFRMIQKMKGTQMRTKLQELGFYQANGKKTRYLQGQDDDSTPMPMPANKTVVHKDVPLNIITKTQLRELRLKLGCTQPEMAARCGVKPKTWANWEYGYCRPPEDNARKLLSQYEAIFGSTSPTVEQKPEVVPHHVRPKSNRPVYESELLPIVKLREYRRESGLSLRETAKRIGVPYTTYNNWEAGNAKPSTEYVEKLLEVFGAPPTKSVTDSVRAQAVAIQRKTDPVAGYEYPAETLKKFRAKHKLTRPQMARLMHATLSQYRNWENPGRGVPLDFTSTFHVLSKLSSENITKRLKSSPEVKQGRLLHAKGEKYTFNADFLTDLRKQLNVRLPQIAQLLGVTPGQFHNWEAPGRGVPPSYEARVKEFVEMDDAAKKKAMEKLGIIPGDRMLVHYSITAEALIAMRKKLGVSTSRFARILNVPLSKYHNWEARNRGVPPMYEAQVRSFMEQDIRAQKKAVKKLDDYPKRKS